MIVVEQIVKDIVAQIPDLPLKTDLHRKPSFHWGDNKELNRYIQNVKGEAYPLVWLLPGIDKHNIDNTVARKCEFIIATREARQELFNPHRYDRSFRIVLNPLTKYLVEGLQTSSATSIGEEYHVRRFPNYSVRKYRDDNNNETIDLWDATKLTCDVVFSDNCLNTIKWQK